VQSSIMWRKLWKSPKPKHVIWSALWYTHNDFLSFYCFLLFIVLVWFLYGYLQLLCRMSC
jgi:hypothetical protein